MRKLVLSLAAASICVSFASATIKGDSSNTNFVEAGESTLLPFGEGEPGLKFNNGPISVNLKEGPIFRIKKLIYDSIPINSGLNDDVVNAKGKYLKMTHIHPIAGLFGSDPIGEVWYEKRASANSKYDVFSVRQIADPSEGSIAPRIGGLVIADASVNGGIFGTDTHVYFGEWSPRQDGPRPPYSTDLNMNSVDRTVWYVGDNALTSVQGSSVAGKVVKYDVLGVHKHVPGMNDFYRGELTATFASNGGDLDGTLSKTGETTIDFAGTTIKNNGSFTNYDDIKGQFYGSKAQALAGIYTGGSGVGDHVAFGGKKK